MFSTMFSLYIWFDVSRAFTFAQVLNLVFYTAFQYFLYSYDFFRISFNFISNMFTPNIIFDLWRNKMYFIFLAWFVLLNIDYIFTYWWFVNSNTHVEDMDFYRAEDEDE